MTMAVALTPGALLGGFRIEAPIGRGGMGVVYRATQLSLERQVALKLISPELAQEERFRERFLREGRLAASLDHPHLLPVYEAGEEAGMLFLAMRLVEGASLAELLRGEGRLAPERALGLVPQLASALEAAHEGGASTPGREARRTSCSPARARRSTPTSATSGSPAASREAR